MQLNAENGGQAPDPQSLSEQHWGLPAPAALIALAFIACDVPGHSIERLPVVALACPVEIEAGSEYVVDGSVTNGVPVVEQTLSVAGESIASLHGTFDAPAPGVVTARLVVTDAAGHVAEARCRIVVVGGDPADDVVDAGPGDVEPPPDVDDDITGRFAFVAYDRSIIEDSSLEPLRQCVDAPVLAVVDLAQGDDDQVDMTLTYCAIVWPELDAWFGVQQTAWSAACVENMNPVHATFARDGDAFAPPLSTLGAGSIVGARVDDDAPLPIDVNDPTLSDDDADGWPAVTLRSSTYAEDIVYRRFVREMSGTIVDADYITGTYRADAEASVVSWRDFVVPVSAGRPSTFRLTRVDDGVTCADIRLDADALLASFPAPTTDDCF
jgi:hypothetical protein